MTLEKKVEDGPYKTPIIHYRRDEIARLVFCFLDVEGEEDAADGDEDGLIAEVHAWADSEVVGWVSLEVKKESSLRRTCGRHRTPLVRPRLGPLRRT